MIDLLDTAPFAQRAERALFRTLRDTAPVYFNPEPGGAGFWNITRYADVAAAARAEKWLISGQGTQIRNKRAEGDGHASVHNADGRLHSALRTPALAALSRSAMARHAQRIRAIADRLVAAAPRGTPFDFVALIARQLPMVVIAEVLGVPADDAATLTDWANTMSDVHAGDAAQADARQRLFAYFRALAQAKRHQPAADVASALIGAFDGPDAAGVLDAYFMLLTVAGNETTRFLLAEGLEALVDQGLVDVLRADPALIPAAIEDMCRLVSPVIHMRRTAAADGEIAGQTIRAGDKVVLWFAAANHDERQFPDPERLDFGRRPNHHLGFGMGAHFCLGAHLARIEVAAFLEAMLASVRHIRVVAPATRTPSNWFAATHSLMLEWE
jgi:cytochrome P450